MPGFLVVCICVACMNGQWSVMCVFFPAKVLQDCSVSFRLFLCWGELSFLVAVRMLLARYRVLCSCSGVCESSKNITCPFCGVSCLIGSRAHGFASLTLISCQENNALLLYPVLWEQYANIWESFVFFLLKSLVHCTYEIMFCLCCRPASSWSGLLGTTDALNHGRPSAAVSGNGTREIP